MENRVVRLYDEKELASALAGVRFWRAAAVFLSLVTLALCIISCLKADRHFPTPALIRTVIISVIGGWIVISIRVFVISKLRCAAKHIKAVLEAPREEAEGSFTLTRERTFIRNGVPMRKITSKNGGNTGALQIWEKKVSAFDPENAVRVRTAYGFIAEYEVKA